MKIIIMTILSLLFISCDRKTENSSQNNTYNIEKIIGNYVTEDYFNRMDRYDWIAVTISKLSDDEASIEIRSRSDIKKPSCSFKGVAKIAGVDTLKSIYEGKAILFIVNKDSLLIKTEKPEDESLLYYFCSGGAKLSGPYIKLNEPLDEEQLLVFNYSKELSLQNVNFIIKSTNQGSLNTLIIEPEGLEIVNNKEIHKIDGLVTNAEIEDLNSDGWPEVLIYINSAESGSYGIVIGYSVNNGKSMSQIYFPDISKNHEISTGYMGQDEYTVVETKLMQRFPIYLEGNTNFKPSGKIRQVQYKLVDGETSRKFEVEKVYEFDKN